MDMNDHYATAVHEAGHALMAVNQGCPVTNIKIGPAGEEAGAAGVCTYAGGSLKAKLWIALAGPIVSAIHDGEPLPMHYGAGGRHDFQTCISALVEETIPAPLRASPGLPSDTDDLIDFVTNVHEGWRPPEVKGHDLRRLRKTAKRCLLTIDDAIDAVHRTADEVRRWIAEHDWFMPRVYRLADVVAERQVLGMEEIVRWMIKEGQQLPLD